MRKEKSPEPHLYTPDYRDTTKDWGKPSWGPFLPWPGPACFSIVIIIIRRAKESQGPSSMREEITPLVTRYLSYLWNWGKYVISKRASRLDSDAHCQ